MSSSQFIDLTELLFFLSSINICVVNSKLYSFKYRSLDTSGVELIIDSWFYVYPIIYFDLNDTIQTLQNKMLCLRKQSHICF